MIHVALKRVALSVGVMVAAMVVSALFIRGYEFVVALIASLR